MCCWRLLESVSAAVPKILPDDITLTGSHASQRLVIVPEEGGDVCAGALALERRR